MWQQAGVQGSGWDYKISYFWWCQNPACGYSTLRNRIEKDQDCGPLRPVWGNSGEGTVWFSVWGAPLDDWANGGSVDDLFTCGERTFRFFRNWSIHSKFPELFLSIIQQEMFKKIIWIKITTFFKWRVSIILLVLFICLVQT